MKLLTLALACTCGCASVQVIGPVADLNAKNTKALNRNVNNLLSIAESTVEAVVALQLQERYVALIQGVRANRSGETEFEKREAAYKKKAGTMRSDIESLTGNMRAERIAAESAGNPLVSQVAFHNWPPKQAAAVEAQFEVIRDLPVSVSLGKRNEYYREAMGDLASASELETAAGDVRKAMRDYRKVVASQLKNAEVMASAFFSAANTGTSPSKFAKGIAESPELLETIGAIVKENTGDEKRKAAAEALIAGAKKKKE